MTLKLGEQHMGLWSYQSYSNDDSWMTLTYLGHGQIGSYRHLYGKKGKTVAFSGAFDFGIKVDFSNQQNELL